ncbi:hypothetical protein N7478_012218 [Penicillium angulare]|uniref:uncharacterized protein n=1 Tax=Penicillium angulare TaxID=116970 RepID=UPI002540BDFE|nr:uncharacterized protein N7478_012218 [Penicillium angulare]KAJ5259237.1 hypothetical protein N7478_012218 [Penicillium angulare]
MRKFALQAFFYDYCIPTSHSSLSGGFLSGLEPMVRNLGLDSPVADACRAAAFASHGIKLHRKFLIYQAEILHQNLLRHLALRIQTPAANSKENLTIAVLLGLYQMIISEENNPGHHTAHAAGVAAILQIDNNYSRVLQTVLTGHPLLLGSRQKIGIPSPRVEIGIDRWLLNILIKFSPMWKRMEAFFAGVPNAQDIFDLALDIKPELIILDRELEDWQKSQKEEFKPVTIDSGVPPSINPGAGYYPGRVDMYIDLYVATLWNISRIALCILKNLMARLPTMPSDDSYSEPDQQTAFHMAEDMIASLPYHLSEDLQIFLKDRHKHTKITNPGRPAGGLLIMHAIHAASRLEILPLDMREYFETCLTWMGKRMGIGQAAFLAEASGIDSKYLMDGWLLILLGLLV